MLTLALKNIKVLGVTNYEGGENMYDSTYLDPAAYAAIFGFFATYSIIILAIAILSIVAMWKLFAKAGKPGWAAIVPFYNTYCLFEISFGNGWMFLLTIIPCVNVVVLIMLCFKLAKAFGQGTGFGFGLLFLSPIFMLILGFGSSQYVGVEKN